MIVRVVHVLVTEIDCVFMCVSVDRDVIVGVSVREYGIKV